MVTRVGGLASGMDIDSIVEKLMSAEKAPLNKLYQQQQKYEWERDAYREINTALSSFDDYLFDNFRLSSNFYKKTVSSTNSSLVTATANSAASGTLSIDGVSQLASSARGVGTSINATGSKKLSDLFEGGSVPTSVKLNAIQANGKMLDKAVEIKIDKNETVDSFVKKLNASNVGITALFENGKLSITAKNMGKNATGAGEVIVESGADVFNKLGLRDAIKKDGSVPPAPAALVDGGALAGGGKNAIFTVNGIATERSSNSFTLNGYTITLNSTFNTQKSDAEYAKNLMTEYQFAVSNLNAANIDLDNKTTNVTNATTTLKNTIGYDTTSLMDPNKATIETEITNTRSSILGDATNEGALNYILNATNQSLNSFIVNLGEDASAKLKELAKLDFSDAVSLKNSIEALETNEDSGAEAIFSDAEISKLKSILLKEEGTEVSKTDSATLLENLVTPLNSFESTLTGAGIADTETKMNSIYTELANVFDKQFELAVSMANQKEADTKLTNSERNFTAFMESEYNITFDENGKAYQDGQEMTDSVNAFLNNQVNTATTVAPVTLTSATDTDNMVDKIKKFIETYNGLVTTINGKLKETYNRNYPPLTEEQKEEMSEDEIEKWEKKAQTGLLRNDSVLTNGLYAMRRTFMDAVGGLGDATINSLAEIGITTSSTTSDGGKLVLNEDKLRDAINKNADQVASIFTQTGTAKDVKNGKLEDTRGIGQRLRDELKSFTGTIEKKAGKTSSTNQTHTIGKRLDEVKNKIDSWLDKLKNIESRYWKQFTAMETAINKANSQSSLFQPSM